MVVGTAPAFSRFVVGHSHSFDAPIRARGGIVE